MASNSFGEVFKITTFGESHGEGIGVVIDGCPAGFNLNLEHIKNELEKRSPGRNAYVSLRAEKDNFKILSGTFAGKTTGAPLTFWLNNNDVKSEHYDSLKEILRPGHANYTYLEKYGLFDYRGAGRASARETAARVAAGAVAKQLLASEGVEVCAYLQQVGSKKINIDQNINFMELKTKTISSPIYCPDEAAFKIIQENLTKIAKKGDSIGGVVAFTTNKLPIGLGDPVYEKIEANLAKAMLSIPASKGFEIGLGFLAATMHGSEHNDLFSYGDNYGETLTNNSGGVLGGITNGMPLYGRVAFKPTSSIKLPQQTTTLDKKSTTMRLPAGSRHDPCVAIRAVMVVEAMLAIVLIDALLKQRTIRWEV